MRILVTNDDGVHAHGISVLEEIARTLSDDVWVCAPASEQSAKSHSLTISHPLRINEMGERRFAVDGTPTDSVLLAVNHLFRNDKKPDLVLSGINHGGNLSDDVLYSGTVAAATEAAMLGIKAIAFSACCPDGVFYWDTASEHAPGIIRTILDMPWEPYTLISVNLPAVPAHAVRGTEITPMGIRKMGDRIVEGLDPRGKSYLWVGHTIAEEQAAMGTDIAAVQNGAIAITPLQLDLTNYKLLDPLRHAFQRRSSDA